MKESILIIEDDTDIRISLETMLGKKGFNAFGVSELDIGKLQEIPDLILMDFYLPGKTGNEVCQTIKNNPATTHIPIIMMSALPTAKKSCFDAGAVAFVDKPFKISELIATIEQSIHQ